MNVILNFILYFLIFIIIHSALAADYIKNKAKRLLGERYRFYRMIYTLISILTFVPAFLLWIKYSGSTPLVYSIPRWAFPLIILARALALGIFVYASYQTDILVFTGLKQTHEKSILITNGAYGIVRHPLYSSGILLLITKMEMSRLDLIAVLLVSIYLIIGAYIEERRLLSIFGDEYRRYRQQVSMFIPVKWVKKQIAKLL
ncbi:MAG: isoprenylcysteine carboxylmethyltransferase family protein [Candidatus Methanoperedens sp.]|nr:isoprenylcysteine carboxylmethyltransferase family protein [Candidatus Methanoperedens sp.]MCZ7403380.1 isoprenylcysteine carboxylmethyltransferase family protein [Candidatus Methanoperedens sp.]